MHVLLDHELLTLKEAQRLLNVNRCAIDEMINSGQLKTIKIGSQFKIEGRQLKNLMAGSFQQNDFHEFGNGHNFIKASNSELSMIADWT